LEEMFKFDFSLEEKSSDLEMKKWKANPKLKKKRSRRRKPGKKPQVLQKEEFEQRFSQFLQQLEDDYSSSPEVKLQPNIAPEWLGALRKRKNQYTRRSKRNNGKKL
jgi:hypothetical protein